MVKKVDSHSKKIVMYSTLGQKIIFIRGGGVEFIDGHTINFINEAFP